MVNGLELKATVIPKIDVSYFLDHDPLHHWGRGHPRNLLVFHNPSPPAKITNTGLFCLQ